MRLRDLLVHIAVTLGYLLVGLAIAAGVVAGHHGSDTPADVRIVAFDYYATAAALDGRLAG